MVVRSALLPFWNRVLPESRNREHQTYKKSKLCFSCMFARKYSWGFNLSLAKKCVFEGMDAEAHCHLGMSHLYLFPFPPLFHSREWGLSVCFVSWHPLELSNNSRNGLAFPLFPRRRDFVIKSKRRTRKKESTNERPHYLYRVKRPWLQQHFSPALWSIYMEL